MIWFFVILYQVVRLFFWIGWTMLVYSFVLFVVVIRFMVDVVLFCLRGGRRAHSAT